MGGLAAPQPFSGDKSAISATSVDNPIGRQDPPSFAKRFYRCDATPPSPGYNLTTGEGEGRRDSTNSVKRDGQRREGSERKDTKHQ